MSILLYVVPQIPNSAITKYGENWASLFFANTLHVPLNGLSAWYTAQGGRRRVVVRHTGRP